MITLNPANGATVSDIGSLSSSNFAIGDITYAPDGNIYATNYSYALLKINPQTASNTLIGLGSIGDLDGIAAIAQQPLTATPTFSPGAGAYTSAQNVTISDTTPGATIYYTTNGTTPTTSSTVYSGPISVSSSETIEAIAAASGYSNSAVASAAYMISALGTQSTTFTYKGNPYGTVSGTTCGGNYCTGGPYALALTFTTTLAGSTLDNLPLTDITSTVTSFNFADGSGLAEDNSTGSFPDFRIATNASGNIVSWYAVSCGSTCNTQMQTNWDTPNFSFQPGADFSETTANFAGSFGFVGADPGTWTQSAGPITQATATPTFLPVAGTYASAQSVTISDATVGRSHLLHHQRNHADRELHGV